jgi:hypothetical protein
MSAEILYSESGRTGTHYEEAKPPDEDEDKDPFFEYRIMLYMKVGTFFNWSWQEFELTPLPVSERLSEEIDFRLQNLGESPLMLNWTALAVLEAMMRALGGSKSGSSPD